MWREIAKLRGGDKVKVRVALNKVDQLTKAGQAGASDKSDKSKKSDKNGDSQQLELLYHLERKAPPIGSQ